MPDDVREGAISPNPVARQSEAIHAAEFAQRPVSIPDRYRLWNPETDGKDTSPTLELSDSVRHGPIGDYLNLLEGNTEASMPAIGIELVASIGSMLGRTVQYNFGRETHYPNLFVVIVGPSSYAAKGIANSEVRVLRSLIDRDFEATHVSSGFGSGENLIRRIRDPYFDKEGEQVGGNADQRLLIQEGELANVFDIANRDGSIYGNVLRDSFDSKTLRTSSNKDGNAVATNPHISIIGGITPEELSSKLSTLAVANGFGNRFLYVWSWSDVDLPFGGKNIDIELEAIATRISRAIQGMRENPTVYEFGTQNRSYSQEAKLKWQDVYPVLKYPDEPGTVGMLLRRGRPIVQRIATIYAAVDVSKRIELEHLEAGLGWFEYGRVSVAHVFGGTVGHGKADAILRELRAIAEPVTDTELTKAFNGRLTAGERDEGMRELVDRKLAVRWRESANGGRPATMNAAITNYE